MKALCIHLSSLYKTQDYPGKSEELAVYICIIGNLEQLVCSYGRVSDKGQQRKCLLINLLIIPFIGGFSCCVNH